jgi:hypothetical protein
MFVGMAAHIVAFPDDLPYNGFVFFHTETVPRKKERSLDPVSVQRLQYRGRAFEHLVRRKYQVNYFFIGVKANGRSLAVGYAIYFFF